VNSERDDSGEGRRLCPQGGGPDDHECSGAEEAEEPRSGVAAGSVAPMRVTRVEE
jgi:hypothetical protein